MKVEFATECPDCYGYGYYMKRDCSDDECTGCSVWEIECERCEGEGII